MCVTLLNKYVVISFCVVQDSKDLLAIFPAIFPPCTKAASEIIVFSTCGIFSPPLLNKFHQNYCNLKSREIDFEFSSTSRARNFQEMQQERDVHYIEEYLAQGRNSVLNYS